MTPYVLALYVRGPKHLGESPEQMALAKEHLKFVRQMIEQKKLLAGDFLGSGGEMLLTEMKDEDLLKLMALDLKAAMKEG